MTIIFVGLMAEGGSYISCQITLPMISANHISPLSFSPVGEKLVTIVNDKLLTIKQLQATINS